MIKKYLRSGVMENGVAVKTEEGSPQGGNLSSLLANIYLNEFDQKFNKRGVPCIRYADDIVLLAKSERHPRLVGKKYGISRRNTETESEPEEKSYSQCICNTKF